jgi:hypothetical protein
MFSTKFVERIETHVLSLIPFSSENRAVYEIIWTNCVGRGRLKVTIWRTRISRTIPKATNTHSQCVILFALSLRQMLHERASVLHLYVFFLTTDWYIDQITSDPCADMSSCDPQHMEAPLCATSLTYVRIPRDPTLHIQPWFRSPKYSNLMSPVPTTYGTTCYL